jgi:hypothetical protein
MQVMMACFTQRQHIRKRILPTMFAEDQMMSFKASVFLPTLLARVVVAHQAGDTHIFIEPRGVLIARSAQGGVIEASDIYLYIFSRDG